METNFYDKPSTETLVDSAFFYWKKTLKYQVLFSLIYFSVFILVLYIAAMQFGIAEKVEELSKSLDKGMNAYMKSLERLSADQDFMYFKIAMMAVTVFLYPMNLGLFKLFRKLDTKEELKFEDLLAGYSGINFFVYIGYFMFWYLIYSYASSTVILGIVWVLLTLLVAPLMFFMNKRIFESISLNFKVLKMYPLQIIACSVVAILFKYFGIITVVGAVFTFPFWNAMIYALYQRFFEEANKLNR